jgi:hypothetical protein
MRRRDGFTGFAGRIMRVAPWLVVAVVAATIVLAFLNIQRSSDPPYLILVLSIIFVGIPCLMLAAIAARSFARTGAWGVLWFGGGTLAFGLAVIISGPMQMATSANATITAHNLSLLIGGILYLLGSFFMVNRISAHIAVALHWGPVIQLYVPTVAMVALITGLSLSGVIPPFFVPGVGGTPFRQLVILLDLLLFLLSGLIILREYARSTWLDSFCRRVWALRLTGWAEQRNCSAVSIS